MLVAMALSSCPFIKWYSYQPPHFTKTFFKNALLSKQGVIKNDEAQAQDGVDDQSMETVYFFCESL